MKYRWTILSICLILSTILTVFVLTNRVDHIDNGVYDTLMEHDSRATYIYFRSATYFANVYIILGIAGVMTLIALIKKKRIGAYLAATLFITAGTNQLLKLLFSRPRPLDIELVVAHGYSFPSGHTMMSTAFYGFLMYMIANSNLSTKAKWVINSIFLFILLNTAISRVYLGVHFFTDVIASILISSCILLVITYIIKKDNGKYFSWLK